MRSIFLVFIMAVSSVYIYAQEEGELTDLMFSENWFSDLEEAKKHPEEVYYLDLSLQKLKSFPPVIFTFKNLKQLLVPVNYWPSIPDKIGTLDQLEVLDISSNYYLNKLPDGLADLDKLKKLIIADNKLNAGEVERARKMLPGCEVIVE